MLLSIAAIATLLLVFYEGYDAITRHYKQIEESLSTETHTINRGHPRVSEHITASNLGGEENEATTQYPDAARGPVEYFKKHQYNNAEYDENLEMYVQDCNRGRALANSVTVALQERHYAFFYSYHMQDMDDMKCAVFPTLSHELIDLPLIDVVSSETEWNGCPEGAVITALYDHDSTFSQPSKMKCSRLPTGFDIGLCRDVIIVPDEGSDEPYKQYISEYNQPADEKWPMECPQLPRPSAIVGFHFHHNNAGDPFWKGFKCCQIDQM